MSRIHSTLLRSPVLSPPVRRRPGIGRHVPAAPVRGGHEHAPRVGLVARGVDLAVAALLGAPALDLVVVLDERAAAAEGGRRAVAAGAALDAVALPDLGALLLDVDAAERAEEAAGLLVEVLALGVGAVVVLEVGVSEALLGAAVDCSFLLAFDCL